MKAQLARVWDLLRTSLWFVPGGMTLVAVILAVCTIKIDEVFKPEATGFFAWIYGGGPEGARHLLATVAGSMATITGVTFSITIVALTMASSQFGSRLLRNFMRDTGNQVVLGTFIATFVFCLLVLRTVRGPNLDVFVPQVSVTIGILLAILSMLVLIYFIHHVSSSLQADSIIASVSVECHSVIDKMLPENGGRTDEAASFEGRNSLERIEKEGRGIVAAYSGYVQAIDRDEVMSLATDNDLIVWLKYRPGDFVIEGNTIMILSPAPRVSDKVHRLASGTMVIGAHRTPLQDIEFAINQLVEVASRALSPGINDPFTAIACVDRLGAILATLAQRTFPVPCRRDEEGKLRMIADEVTFKGAVDAAFNQIRQYSRTNPALLIRMLETIGALAEFARRPADRDALLAQARMVLEAGRDAVPDKRDRDNIEERYRAVQRAYGEPETYGSSTIDYDSADKA